jgi:hypothetical protein
LLPFEGITILVRIRKKSACSFLLICWLSQPLGFHQMELLNRGFLSFFFSLLDLRTLKEKKTEKPKKAFLGHFHQSFGSLQTAKSQQRMPLFSKKEVLVRSFFKPI